MFAIKRFTDLPLQYIATTRTNLSGPRCNCSSRARSHCPGTDRSCKSRTKSPTLIFVSSLIHFGRDCRRDINSLLQRCQKCSHQVGRRCNECALGPFSSRRYYLLALAVLSHGGFLSLGNRFDFVSLRLKL